MGKKNLACMFFGILLMAWIPMAETAARGVQHHRLDVFGNANEDPVLDMRDVTYTERIIQGLAPPSRLADAQDDGRVDIQDITQTQLIIAGKEKKLTILDNDEDAVTIPKPVKRVIPDHMTALSAMQVLHAEGMVVGIDTAVKKHMGPIFLQDLAHLPLIGDFSNPDYEAVLSLKPDVYLSYRSIYGPGGKKALREKLPGVTVIETGFYTPYNPDNLETDMRKLGYILDKREEAEAYIGWYKGYLHMIRERIATLSIEEKPRVFPAPGWDLYNCIASFQLADIAGGINICSGLGPTYATVDPEWMIKQNPEVILKQSFSSKAYDTDDPFAMIAEREDIMNRPELAEIEAIKKNRVYLWHMYTSGMFPNDIITIAHIAKWLHPHLFENLDPQRIHQEYVDRFSCLDFNVKKHGVFVYPPLEN